MRSGRNFIDGIEVDVVRKRIRRINVRVTSDGIVHLSVPIWWATLAEGEAFLRANWKWVVTTRAKAMLRPAARAPVTDAERAVLMTLLQELTAAWALRLDEPGVTWKLGSFRTIWGSCHFRRRLITYNTELARVPRELVEYVVVHELTHLKVPNHGPAFKALMDGRIPDWRLRRRRLNKRQF